MASIDTKTIIQYLTVMELPLNRAIDPDILKAQFRKLSIVYHPDTSREVHKDGKMFILLKEAYDFLSANTRLVNALIASDFKSYGPNIGAAELAEAVRRAEAARSMREAAERKEREEQARRAAAERRAAEEVARRGAAERAAASTQEETAELERKIREEEAHRAAMQSAAEARREEEERQRKAKEAQEIAALREEYDSFLSKAKGEYDLSEYDERGTKALEDIFRRYAGKKTLIFSRADLDNYTSSFLAEMRSVKTKKARKKARKRLIISCIAAAVAAASVGIAFAIKGVVDENIRSNTYQEAASLMNKGSYQDALDHYRSLGNYGDAENKAKVCEGLVKLEGSISSKSEADVVSGIKSIVSGGESVKVTYSSSDGRQVKRRMSLGGSDSYTETISEMDFKLYTPKENEGYTFQNWYSTFLDYSGQATLSLDSKWDLNQYSISYVLDGGTNAQANPSSYSILSDEIVLQAASKEHHSFLGWFDRPVDGNKILSIPKGSTGNVTLYARYEINHYTVNFYDWDYTKLHTATVDHGSAAEYPFPSPTRTADQQYTYSFKGWNKSLLNVTEDTDFVAQYETTANQYTVTFKNWDGEVLDTCTVDYGEDAFYSGKTPTKPNSADDRHYYTYSGWNKSLENVQNSYEVQATFDEGDRYLARFYNGDELLFSEMLNENEMPEYEGDVPEKASDQQYHYAFSNWDPAPAATTEDTDYLASFTAELNKYTVTFKNYDGTVLGTDTVDYGTAASYKGDTPEKPKDQQYTYSFSGWDISLDSITENVDAIAQYQGTLNKYTVTFKNYDGTVLGTDTVDYGTAASYKGETPEKPKTQQYTFAFKGWDISLDSITEDVVATAQFSNATNKYTVTFKNYDGTILATDTVEYGTDASYDGPTPTKPDADGDCAFRFVGWSGGTAGVQSDYDVFAQYEMYLKNATFALNDDEDGYILQTYAGSSPYVHIPDTHYGLPIVEIGSAFNSNSTLVTVDICDSVEVLRSMSLTDCVNLETVKINPTSSLKTVEGYVFTHTDKLFKQHHYQYDEADTKNIDTYITHLDAIFPQSTFFEAHSVHFTNLSPTWYRVAVLYYEEPDYPYCAQDGTRDSTAFEYPYQDPYYGLKWHPISMGLVSAATIDDISSYNGERILTRMGAYNLTHIHADCCD